MDLLPPSPTKPRTWQEVARERGITLRVLGEYLKRNHQTMRAYSVGIRPMPDILLEKLARLFGESVR